jgi:hypothetical protein
VLLGLGAFCVVLAFIYYLAKLLLTFLGTAQSQISGAIVTGSLAATASVIILVITKRLEQQEAIRQEHRSKKIPIYEEVIGLIFRILFADKMGERPLEGQTLIKEFSNITQKLLIWGSDDVINAYVAFRNGSLAGTDTKATLKSLDSIFLAIRRDIGHKNKGLSEDSLLKLFINDLPK